MHERYKHCNKFFFYLSTFLEGLKLVLYCRLFKLLRSRCLRVHETYKMLLPFFVKKIHRNVYTVLLKNKNNL